MKQFLLECLRSLDLLDEHDLPRLSIWGVSDAGANIICALKLLKEAGIIEGWHNCFNHKLQLVIQDGIKTTPGMEATLDCFQKNAAMYSRSRKERKLLREECKRNDTDCTIPPPANATRWFGNFRQIQDFLKAPDPHKVHIAKSEKMYHLSPSDWKKAKG